MTREQVTPLLFTPGPLSTSPTVKKAMLEDVGSRDRKFIDTVGNIRAELLRLANVTDATHTAILMQGSGTFGVESVITSAVASDSKLLIVANGAYGQRIRQIAALHKMNHKVLEFDETEVVDIEQVKTAIMDHAPTHLAVVHCETTTGRINPIEAIAALCEKHHVSLIVDAMSSFGGIAIDLQKLPIDFLVSSSNKCLQGVPGFSFIIATLDAVRRTEGHPRSLVLDLHSQWRALEKDGQFRFTPPTHTILAFQQALVELREEGGIEAREKRYRGNHKRVMDAMTKMGFVPLLPHAEQGPIITSFLYPTDANFDFNTFYAALNSRGLVIYPGKVSKANCFRIGHIGHLFADDCDRLIEGVSDVVKELGIRLNA